MFCDINNFCQRDKKLRDFLLDRYSKTFYPKKYKVYMYMTNSVISTQSGVSVICSNSEMTQVSSIIHYPIGLELYINKPKDFVPNGVCINNFLECEYDEVCDASIIMPLLNIDSFFPSINA